MERETLDRLDIRAAVENWVIWRDARDWSRFATLWHPDGIMMATWFQGSAADFIAVSQEGFDKGVRIWHTLGGTSVDVRQDRAIAQTKMSITQRVEVDGVLCDVVCTGRFYDFFERCDGRWLLWLRQPVYERDRIDPVQPGRVPHLDLRLLSRFPEGYRHLAYVQSRIGYEIKPDMPGLTGPALDALYRRGEGWLAGSR